MEWLQFVQVICIPLIGWVVYHLSLLRRDLEDFKVHVAEQYSTKSDIRRIENKIDDVHGLLVDALRKKEI